MSDVLTEGRVGETILSFGKEDFLFTGTVCRTWRENSVSTETGTRASVESLSRTKEACDSGICTNEAAFVAIEEGSDLSIFQYLFHRGIDCWDGVHLEVAVSHGRLDVMEFIIKSGQCLRKLNEGLFHLAVSWDQLESVKYLLSRGCPVDKACLHYRDMRSLEVAICRRNLEMVKTVRTVDYPFIEDTFRVACKTKNMEVMKYLHEEGCQPDENLCFDLRESDDVFSLTFFFKHGYFRDEWETFLSACIYEGHHELVTFFLGEGVVPDDDCVNSAISIGDLGNAKFLTRKYPCRPTSQAYIEAFNNDCCNCRRMHVIDWLYDNMKCSIGFSSFQEMQNDFHGSYILDKSPVISDWFRERLC